VLSPRIAATADDRIALRLPAHERELLQELAEEMAALLREDEADDPALGRLFPSAHEDAELDREFRELTRSQLVAGKERAVEVLAETADRETLSLEEADAWLRALNDARLVLGTRTEVTEEMEWDELDPRDPRAPQLAVYAYLSWIQEELVAALGTGYSSPGGA